MLKNLLTKKLYQLLVLIPLISINVNAASWTETPSSDGVYTVVKNTDFGDCIFQNNPAPLQYVNFANIAGGVFYAPYGGALNKTQFLNFCATVTPKSLILKLPFNPTNIYYVVDSGRDPVIIKNDGGVDNTFDLFYGADVNININPPSITSGIYLKGGDAGNIYQASGTKNAYQVCLDANKANSVVGLKKDGSLAGYFADLNSCKAAVENNADIGIKAVRLENETCTVLENGGTYGTIATYTEGVLKEPLWERCRCITKAVSGYSLYQGIFYIDEQGRETQYSSVTESLFFALPSTDPKYTNWIQSASRCLSDHDLLRNKFITYNIKVGGCYDNITDCFRAVCEEKDLGKYQYGGQFYETISKAIDVVCAGLPIECRSSKNTSSKIKKCDCSTSYNVNYTPLLCASGRPVGSNCDPACKLIPVNAQSLNPVSPRSPLAIINVIVNLLFWFAVMLLILNFITAGIEMVQSGNEPQKMKEATERIQSTIFGFIFVLVASGVINYLISFIGNVIQ